MDKARVETQKDQAGCRENRMLRLLDSKNTPLLPNMGQYLIVRRLMRKKPFEGGAGTVSRGSTQEESEA
jgi:hypothetical protein